MSTLIRQECSRCGEPVETPLPRRESPCCTAPVVSRYDLAAARNRLPAPGAPGERGVWRYREVLPLPRSAAPVSLGEGGTPLLPAPRLGAEWEVDLFLKDESANPTGSFKDRGMTVAISLAAAAGAPGVVLPTAGNAGASAAAYGARAGLPVSIHAPEATPREILSEIRLRGARLTLHPGTIADAGRAAALEAERSGAHPVATFREPGRVEGKKTMGYEVFEQLGRVPDAIVYPCGGGTGVVGMAQAFDEMEALGWIGPERPRIFVAQSEGCAPVVQAFHAGLDTVPPWEGARTFAAGLCVPAAFADRLILGALRRTDGGAIALSEADIAAGGRLLAARDGILPCPEGAAALAAVEPLIRSGALARGTTVVVFQTGSALKYLEAWETALGG